jgi:hypothetical protein
MLLNLRDPTFKAEHLLCNFYGPWIGSSFIVYLMYYIKKWIMNVHM